MPTAYTGECDETPELSNSQKDAIYETFLNYFIEKNIVTSRVSQYTDGTQKEYFDMNKAGETFINKYYFPFLQRKNPCEIRANPWPCSYYSSPGTP